MHLSFCFTKHLRVVRLLQTEQAIVYLKETLANSCTTPKHVKDLQMQLRQR